MSEVPQVLLAHHLKALKLPTFLRELYRTRLPGQWVVLCGAPEGLLAPGGAHVGWAAVAPCCTDPKKRQRNKPANSEAYWSQRNAIHLQLQRNSRKWPNLSK